MKYKLSAWMMLSFAVAALLLCACGDDGGDGGKKDILLSPDAGNNGDVLSPEDCLTDMVEGFCRPEAPADVVLTDWTCAEGFEPVPLLEDAEPLEGLQTANGCQPTIDDFDCPIGMLPSVAEGGCVRMTGCPGGERWHDEDTIRGQAQGSDATIWYVAPGDDGDGSRDNPFSTINAAIEAAEPGDILAVGMGSYTENVRLLDPFAIIGACAEGTTLTGDGVSDTSNALTVTTVAGGSIVSGLTIDGPRPGLTLASSTTVSDVIVESSTISGIVAVGEQTTSLTRVIVRNILPRASDQFFGLGLNVENGAVVTAHQVAVLDNRLGAVVVKSEGTSLEMTDSIIAGTSGQDADGTFGRGAEVTAGARFTMNQGIIADTNDYAVHQDDDATVELADVFISGSNNAASLLRGGSDLTAERVWMVGNRGGVSAVGEGIEAVLTDVAITNTLPDENDRFGRALDIGLEASVTVRRGMLRSSREIAVYALDGGRYDLEDVVVTDTEPALDSNELGRGINLEGGSSMRARRVIIARNVELALGVFGSELDAEDLRVVDTESRRTNQYFGRGMSVGDGGHAKLTRAQIARNRGFGVFVDGEGNVAELNDVFIHDTMARGYDGLSGVGVASRVGSRVVMRRSAIMNSHHYSVEVALDGEFDFKDGYIGGSHASPCGDDCPENGGGAAGTGIICILGSVKLENFHIEKSQLAGLQLVEPTEFSAADGVITRNTIGVNLQAPSVVVEEAFDNVDAFDNDVDFDSSELPVPTADGLTDVFEL